VCFDALYHTLLPKRISRSVFASDPMRSVAYAAVAAYAYAPWAALVVVLALLTVVAIYRKNVRAYPSGGRDSEVATDRTRRKTRTLAVTRVLQSLVCEPIGRSARTDLRRAKGRIVPIAFLRAISVRGSGG
jgi:hypothetical protein